MNTTTTFTSPTGSQIRVVDIQGSPWFIAADVCRALDLADDKGSYGHHIMRLAPEDRLLTPRSSIGVTGKGGSIGLVSEPGLYKLVLRSDKAEAKAFQDWVTRDVLPAIRKDGAYVLGEEKVKTGEMSNAQMVFKLVEEKGPPRRALKPIARRSVKVAA